LKTLLQVFFNNSTEAAVTALLDVSPSKLTTAELDRLSAIIEGLKGENDMVLLTGFSALLDPAAAAWPSALLIGSLKGTLVLCAAALLSVVLRHRSASVRHLVWLTGLCGLLFMPLLSSSMGIWEVTISSPIVSTVAPARG
jgi:hypothetical protein